MAILKEVFHVPHQFQLDSTRIQLGTLKYCSQDTHKGLYKDLHMRYCSLKGYGHSQDTPKGLQKICI